MNDSDRIEDAPRNPFYTADQPDRWLRRRDFLELSALSFGWSIARPVNAGPADKGREKGPGMGQGNGGKKEGKAREDRDYRLPDRLSEFERISIVLGRATDHSITASVLAAESLEGFLEIGKSRGEYARKIGPLNFQKNQVVEVFIDQLSADTEYFYRVQSRPKDGNGSFTPHSECRFSTQRAPGSAFVFTVQGDSHPERPQSSHPELYARTLETAAADRPDFHICIGDDFSVEKVPTVTHEALAKPYLLQRPFLGVIGRNAPVFLINGNHEQASLYNYMQSDQRRDVAIGAQLARNRIFPTPGPDSFYSGNTTPLKDIGLLKDYCAWTWGDALFILLDNYWHSPALVDSGFRGEDANPGKKPHGDEKKNRDWWSITLGDQQYQWLKRTLEESKAKYKFVFAHHVLGSGRGGIEEAGLYEWGGGSKKGEPGFSQMRPTWDLPIHQLMVKHKVSVFFQGHDHLYCQQERDGVVYQELPMPSDHGYVAYNEDRYLEGRKLPSSGYLRISVGPQETKVEYVRSYLPKDETAPRRQGEVAHSYSVKPRIA